MIPSKQPEIFPKLRVLVVEDNMDYLELIRTLLESLSFEVKGAYSAKEAIEIGRQFCPEIVLCDLSLGDELDGCVVARTFRKDSVLRQARLIALTGFQDEEHKASAKNAGFDSHIVKTGDIDALLKMMQSLQAS